MLTKIVNNLRSGTGSIRINGRLIGDFEAHLAGGAGDDAEGGFVVARVEVLALGVHDVHDLFARDLADFGFVRLFGAGSDIGCFL